VNLFRGRVKGSKAYIGDAAIELPEYTQPEAANAVVYIRPHLIDLALQPQGNNHFRAKVKEINVAGPLVKIELATKWGDKVQVEMSHERFRTLALQKETEVFASPKEIRVFAE
jgi:sulfate transport system ATP-binding protein